MKHWHDMTVLVIVTIPFPVARAQVQDYLNASETKITSGNINMRREYVLHITETEVNVVMLITMMTSITCKP